MKRQYYVAKIEDRQQLKYKYRKKEKKDIEDNLSQKHGGKVIEILTLYNTLWRIGPKEKKQILSCCKFFSYSSVMS